MAEKVLTSQMYHIKEARAHIQTDFAAPSVHFLPQEVENVLNVLISNALCYRDPTRRPLIKLSSWQEDDNVCVAVQDNGAGVDLPADADKVFGLFQSAHSQPQGAGVALYSVRRMLERLGGSITARGARGEGCTFELRFPRAEKGRFDGS
jgi:light-regulated signal transduction histidine kinase (bacteriophytochrome)